MNKDKPNYPKAIKQLLSGAVLIGIGLWAGIYLVPRMDETHIKIRSYGFVNDMYLGITTIIGIMAIGCASLFFGVKNITRKK